MDKARAVQMALRTLAPQVILLDELGSLEETMALEQGFFSGVDFIASIHAPDAAQAQCRPQVQALLQRGMLRQVGRSSLSIAPGRGDGARNGGGPDSREPALRVRSHDFH